MSDPAAPAPQGAPEKVFVVEATRHTLDQDSYEVETEEFLVDEGYFSDEASAEVRVAQLNQRNRDHYNVAVDRQRREHQAKVDKALRQNKEAAAIRAAGMTKADVPVPEAFEPESFESFSRPTQSRGLTTYAVVAVDRSDHDGLSAALTVADVEAAAATPELADGDQG